MTQDNMQLLALTPRIGGVSETFIHAHLEALAPGATRVICRQVVQHQDVPHTVVDQRLGSKPTRDRLSHLIPAVRRLRNREWSPSKAAWRIFEDHLERGPEAVLVEYLDQFSAFAARAADSGHRVFLHAHGYDASARLRSSYWRERYVQLGSVAKVIAVSEHMRNSLVKIGVPRNQVVVIPCGVAAPSINHGRPTEGQPLACIAVGRLIPKKNILTIVNAVHGAASAGVNLRLEVIGDGPLRRPAEHLVKTLGLGDRILFSGARQHDYVLNAVASADVFLQNSVVDKGTGDEEGMPVAILEAMSLGRAIVTTRHAGIPEAIVDEHTGLLCTEDDASDFTEAIVRLARDPSLRGTLGESARDMWRSRFTRDGEIAALRSLMFPQE